MTIFCSYVEDLNKLLESNRKEAAISGWTDELHQSSDMLGRKKSHAILMLERQRIARAEREAMERKIREEKPLYPFYRQELALVIKRIPEDGTLAECWRQQLGKLQRISAAKDATSIAEALRLIEVYREQKAARVEARKRAELEASARREQCFAEYQKMGTYDTSYDLDYRGEPFEVRSGMREVLAAYAESLSAYLFN